MYNMPLFLFTFRPHINEQSVFDDFLTIFLPEIKNKCSKYSYAIEDADKLTRHIHILAEMPPACKDYSKFSQLFNKKVYSAFRDSLKNKLTNDHGFDDRKVNEDPHDFLKVLGYVNKDTSSKKVYEGFTNEQILEGVEYYYASKHIEKSKVENDWTILSPKNFHVIIEDYIEKNNIDKETFNPAILERQMIEDKISFAANLTRDKIMRMFAEIITSQKVHKDLDHYVDMCQNDYIKVIELRSQIRLLESFLEDKNQCLKKCEELFNKHEIPKPFHW